MSVKVSYVSDVKGGEYRLEYVSIGTVTSRCPWEVLKVASRLARAYNTTIQLSDEAARKMALLAEESID